MKAILTILFLFILIPNKAQEFETTLILEVNQQWYAGIIQKRFDRAIASNHYFQCDTKYCFEIDEDDMTLRFGLFKRRVIPKRFYKRVEMYEIFPMLLEDGSQFYLE